MIAHHFQNDLQKTSKQRVFVIKMLPVKVYFKSNDPGIYSKVSI